MIMKLAIGAVVLAALAFGGYHACLYLAAFRNAPESYAPQFGGYCAYAVANGYTAKTLPEAWHIADGKLYLNFDLSVRETWRAKQAEFIAAGAKNWPGVIQD